MQEAQHALETPHKATQINSSTMTTTAKDDLWMPKKPLMSQKQCSVGFSEATNTYSRGLPDLTQVQKPEGSITNPGLWPTFPSDFTSQVIELNPAYSRQLKWKKLVPKELSVGLSGQYEDLLKVASIIDQRLFKMKRCGFRESFENLKMVILREIDFELEIQTIQRINYLVEGFLVVCQDPLKNVAVGLPANKTTKTQRKRQLRTNLFKFAITQSHGQIRSVQVFIPLKPLQLIKIEAFFPQTIMSKPNKSSPKTLDEKALKNREKEIKLKEQKLEEDFGNKQATEAPSADYLRHIGLKIIEVYKKHKVQNMFKTDLVESLRRMGQEPAQVMQAIQSLVKTGVFIRCFDSANLTVCEMQPSELDRALQLVQQASQEAKK